MPKYGRFQYGAWYKYGLKGLIQKFFKFVDMLDSLIFGTIKDTIQMTDIEDNLAFENKVDSLSFGDKEDTIKFTEVYE